MKQIIVIIYSPTADKATPETERLECDTFPEAFSVIKHRPNRTCAYIKEEGNPVALVPKGDEISGWFSAMTSFLRHMEKSINGYAFYDQETFAVDITEEGKVFLI